MDKQVSIVDCLVDRDNNARWLLVSNLHESTLVILIELLVDLAQIILVKFRIIVEIRIVIPARAAEVGLWLHDVVSKEVDLVVTAELEDEIFISG